MSTLNDQLLKIVEDYRTAGEPWPASREQIAEWAVANERYQLTRGMAVSQCAEKISRAMGLDHVKDKKGRSVRKYYAARIRENGQLVMKWDDLNAERPFMEVAAANRRNQVLGQCWQLKTDIDSYNERKCPEEPIQMDFNFNIDLEELSQLDDIAQSVGFFPSGLRRKPRYILPLFWCKPFRTDLRAAWATEFPARYCASAFPLFLGRRLTVLDLPARDIDNELGRLAEIARAFGGLCH